MLTAIIFFCNEKKPFLLQQIEELFEETELPTEQARMIIEGAAYYDIEDDNGQWLRILCEYGDLLILPAGKLHRFTTTPKV